MSPQLWLLNSDSLVLWAPEEAVTADSPSLRPPSPSQSHAAASAMKLLYVDCAASEDDSSQQEYDTLIRPSIPLCLICVIHLICVIPSRECVRAPLAARSRCV